MAASTLSKTAPPRSVRTLPRTAFPLHLLGLASFLFSFYTLTSFHTAVSDKWGWHFQYLTVIGLLFSTLTFTAAVLADAISSPALYSLKNALAVVAAPLEVLISLLYWGIRIIDPKLLILEADMTPVLWFDLSIHLAPAVVLILDLLCFSPPWTVRGYSAVGLGVVLALVYWVWVEYCFGLNGLYPYPIMELMTRPQRAMLFALSGSLFAGSSVALKWLYGRVNGAPAIAADASRPLKKVQ